MTAGITGVEGFLGWHLRCRLLSQGVSAVPAGRGILSDASSTARFVEESRGHVFHIAGVNRADSDDLIRSGNVEPAAALAKAIQEHNEPTTVVYANSVKADQSGAYGEAKAEAAAILRRACEATGGRFVDVRFPHLYGEFGVPFYNSAVTTFAYQVANGETSVVNDGDLELLHVQDAAQILTDAAYSAAAPLSEPVRPKGVAIGVRDAHDLIARLAVPYVETRTFPELADDFELHLFNMVRSQMWPDGYPYQLTRHADHRGAFFEATRAFGQGQTSISTTVPGVVRGEHYHFDKVERFVVVSGEAVIRVRRLFDNDVVEFRVDGEQPSVIDMPPLCTHDITNVGSSELVTMFWSHDHFNPERADTFPLPVTGEELPA